MVTIYADLAKEVQLALDGKVATPLTCPIRKKAPDESDVQIVPVRLRALLTVWWLHKVKDRPETGADTEQHIRYEQCIGSIKMLLDAVLCGDIGVKYHGQKIRYYADWEVVVE